MRVLASQILACYVVFGFGAEQCTAHRSSQRTTARSRGRTNSNGSSPGFSWRGAGGFAVHNSASSGSDMTDDSTPRRDRAGQSSSPSTRAKLISKPVRGGSEVLQTGQGSPAPSQSSCGHGVSGCASQTRARQDSVCTSIRQQRHQLDQNPARIASSIRG